MGVITTKSGDKGQTHLKDKLVSKGSVTIETVGTLDEVIANLILTQALTHLDRSLFTGLIEKINEINAYLTGFKSDLYLEGGIAEMDRAIASRQDHYSGFVFPYDDIKNAQLNVLRTVVRRAERTMVRLHEESALPKTCLVFMNRLSDYIFVLIG